MRLFIFLFISLIFNTLCAQNTVRGKLEKSNEKFKNTAQSAHLRQTLSTSNGRAIAVGSIENGANGQDAYLVIFNPSGQEMVTRNIGSKRDDAFNAVVQLPNGTFIAGGYTHDDTRRRKAWLVQLSADSGKIMRQEVYDMDAFYALTVDDEGAVYAFSAREKDPSVELACLKIRDWKVEFDKKFTFGNSIKNIKSATKAADGGVVVVGETQKSGATKEDDIWLLKLDKQGKNTFLRRYGEERFTEMAEQIISTSDNGFAIVGSTNNSNGENFNAWLVKVDEAGNKQWEKNYGGNSVDLGQSVIQTSDNKFYVVGRNMSHRAGMRFSDVYFVKTDPSGNLLWEDFDGEKQNDEARMVTPLYDGTFLLTAHTEGSSWLYRFRSFDEDISVVPLQNNTLRRSDWRILTDDGFLDQNQNTALSVRFTNMGQTIKNVQIKCKSNNPAIQPQNLTYLGAFQSSESRIVAIPIKTGVGLDDNSYNLDFEILTGAFSAEKFTYKVTTKRQIAGRITLNTPPQYASQKDGSQLVTLTVENRTNQAAQGLSFRVEPPRGLKIMAINETGVKLPLDAGKKATVSFQYQGEILRELGGETPKFTCSILQKGSPIDAIKVDATPLSKTTQNSTAAFLTWESPNEDEIDIQNIVVNKPIFDIKLKAFVNETVKREQFKLFMDEMATDGSKMDVVDFDEPTTQQQRPIYKTRLTLEPLKRYQIRVDLQLANGSIVSSKTVSVRYNPEQPNLHVLSIGAAHKDLKYTGKDAKNIADFFRAQRRLPFKKVHVEDYTDSAKTDYRNFRRTFRELARRFDESAENRIEEKDYLVVFISSHGKTGSERNYQLLPSDYNPTDDDAIDYQTDVMAQLNKIKCHKIVLIDACHSGAMKGAKSNPTADALMAISKAAIGTTTIVSCDANELSYEDESWQNGAFTKALLEAFKNESCSDESGVYNSDADANQLITLGEIVTFIKRRVPKLVAAQKRQTGQNPVVIHDDLDREIPLSIVKQ